MSIATDSSRHSQQTVEVRTAYIIPIWSHIFYDCIHIIDQHSVSSSSFESMSDSPDKLAASSFNMAFMCELGSPTTLGSLSMENSLRGYFSAYYFILSIAVSRACFPASSVYEETFNMYLGAPMISISTSAFFNLAASTPLFRTCFNAIIPDSLLIAILMVAIVFIIDVLNLLLTSASTKFLIYSSLI